MSYNPQVKYWVKEKNKRWYKYIYVCFANLNTKPGMMVRYVVPVDKKVSIEAANFYISFLKELLDGKRFTTRLVSFKKSKNNYVHLNLKCESECYKKEWLHLTAFRYLNEFPEIVSEFFNRKTEDLDKDFELFQELHKQYFFKSEDFNMKKVKYDNLGGHGLIYNSGEWYSHKECSLSVEQFKSNLQQNFGSIHRYFKKV